MEEKLLEYFSKHGLKILDGNSPASNTTRDFYVAVTLEYIIKYVLEDKYSEQEVFRKLFELFAYKSRKITISACSHLNRIVFGSRLLIQFWYLKEVTTLGKLPTSDRISTYNEEIEYLNNLLDDRCS